jgi:hypothetical protein
VRIGTGNLAGRWSPAHRELLVAAECDVWLLTEVALDVELDGFARQVTTELMQPDKWWAGVFSRRPLIGLPDPHPASAAAMVDGVTYCSSILPWRSCGGELTWPGIGHAGKTAAAVDRLLETLPADRLVWGGDWNQSLRGPEKVGSTEGRAHVLAAVEKLGLQVPTAAQRHRLEGLSSIDHIAVASDRAVLSATQVSAVGLSDHDCYVVELADAS